MESKIVAKILCKNDLLYMRDLIPKCQSFCDHIVVVADCPTDGTYEYLQLQPNVELVTRKFDMNFSNQRNAGLERINDGDWVFRIDSDETPSDWCIENIRQVINVFKKKNLNRTSIPIYHMVNTGMCRVEVGYEVRLFKKNPTCIYKGKCHEVIHGEFGQDQGQSELPAWCSLLHWKYADPARIKYTEEFFIPNGLYDPKDFDRRKDTELSFLPPMIKYTITPELRKYLCSNTSLKTKE